MKTICVYLGANTGNNPVLSALASKLGQLIAQNQVRLVYGGSSCGLMGRLAEAVLSNGGQVTGIISRSLVEKEKPLDTLNELIVTETIQERKLLLQKHADAFLVFPGGLGTLEEAFETWNAIKLGTLSAPMGFLNVNGYYSQLFEFILSCKENGFITPKQATIPLIDSDVSTLFLNLKRRASHEEVVAS